MSKSIFLPWLRRQPRRFIQSRTVAYMLGELPPHDAEPLFYSFAQSPIMYNAANWRFNVHMTAENALVGKTHFQQLHAFISRNPAHRFYFWNDNSCIDFMEDHFKHSAIGKVFESIHYGIVRADIFRLCVLLVHGGMYFDMKSQFQGPLSLLNYSAGGGYLVQEPHSIQDQKILQELRLPIANQLTNWMLAFPPEHWFLKAAIKEIVQQYNSGKALNGPDFKVAVWEFSGPRMITRVANRFWSKSIDIEIIPHDCKLRQPVYACRGSWVRTLIYPHYTNAAYTSKK